MSHPFANVQPEPWEILDRHVVSYNGDRSLQWWLLPTEAIPTGVWGPVIVSTDNFTVLDWPVWAPLPGSQNLFLSCPVFETLLAGSRGGGKSLTLLLDFSKECGKGWGASWRGILFRQELGDLDEMVRKTEEIFKPIFPGFRFLQSKADYACVWPDGERLLFRHLKDITEYKEYHGHVYPWIGFEELTQWPDSKAYLAMFSTCRPTAPGVPLRVRANCNPSGTGHNWVKKRFQLPGMFGRVVRMPGEEHRIAINSRLDENFVLLHSDPNYKRRVVQSATSASQAKAWGEGEWDISEGGVIDDLWKPQVHIVPNLGAQRLPSGWKISRSYDHGQSRPFSVLWWAESNGEPIRLPDGRYIGQVRGDLLLFAEWYGTNGQENTGLRMPPSAIARGIKDRERDLAINLRCVGGPADTEIWSRVGSDVTRSPADDFEDEGIFWDKADKSHGSRARGWTRLREYIDGAVPHHDGTRDKPGLFVCMRCKYWLELVPPMPRDIDNPDDVPSTYEDHCFSDDTEVLTHAGWKPWAEASMDDEYATVEARSGALQYQRPSRVIHRAYHGSMVHINAYPSEALVTPGHEMVVLSSAVLNYEKRAASTLDLCNCILGPGGTTGGTTGGAPFEAFHIKVLELIRYDGNVHCATVPNGTLIVRRHGQPIIAGNCADSSRYRLTWEHAGMTRRSF